MKTVYSTVFLDLLLALTITGCKEKEDAGPSLEAQIKGTWSTTLVRINFYDQTGNLIHEESDTDQNGNTMQFQDGGKGVSNSINFITAFTYQVYQRDKNKFLTLIIGRDTTELEITMLSDTKLIMVYPYHWLYYTKNGERKIASKAVYIKELKKQ